MHFDIAMMHPWSADVFPQLGMKGVAAKRMEERKEAKCSKLYSSTGEKSSVVPLVFEHFGRWGKRQKHTCQVWHQGFTTKKAERVQLTSNVTGDDELQSKYKNVMQK